MKLHFDLAKVKALHASSLAAKSHLPGYQPGDLMVVGDRGIYLMSGEADNPPIDEAGHRLVAYAKECDPTDFGSWRDVKDQAWGGDDGVDRLARDMVELTLANGKCGMAALRVTKTQIGTAFPSKKAKVLA